MLCRPGFSENNKGPYLWRLLTNSWRANGKLYCNDKFSICVTNVPQWPVGFHRWWKPFETLISFAVINKKMDGKLELKAEVFVGSPFPLNLKEFEMRFKTYEISTPLEYLTLYLRREKDKVKNFKLLQNPEKVLINGMESARARFDLVAEIGELYRAESYVFLHDSYVYMIGYQAPMEAFEAHHLSAMKIIESVRFDSDQETKKV